MYDVVFDSLVWPYLFSDVVGSLKMWSGHIRPNTYASFWHARDMHAKFAYRCIVMFLYTNTCIIQLSSDCLLANLKWQ